MKRIIINADDFGYSHAVNEAIVECFKRRYITQTTIMTNMPFYDEAVKYAKENNLMDKIGLHINLDEGFPLTEDIKGNRKFCNQNGEYNGEFHKSKLNTFWLAKHDKECLEFEIEAQMQKYIESGFSLMNIDSHHHVHTNYSILKVIIPLAKHSGFNSMRLSRNIFSANSNCSKMKKIYKKYINNKISSNFKTVNYFGPYSDYENNRNKDNVEIMVHPDIIDEKVVDFLNRKKREFVDIKTYCYE